MGIPRKLKHFNLFHNGVSYLGQASEITLPKLAVKVESYRGAGMQSELDVDLGLEKLELEITCGGLVYTTFHDLGLVNVDGAMMRFAGSYQREDDGGADAVEAVCRGKLIEIDPGSSKPGDDTELKLKYTVSYYKLLVNGRTLIEIDVLNLIYIVNGVDRLAQHRRNIGL